MKEKKINSFETRKCRNMLTCKCSTTFFNELGFFGFGTSRSLPLLMGADESRELGTFDLSSFCKETNKKFPKKYPVSSVNNENLTFKRSNLLVL